MFNTKLNQSSVSSLFTMVYLKSGKIKQFYHLQLNGLMREFLYMNSEFTHVRVFIHCRWIFFHLIRVGVAPGLVSSEVKYISCDVNTGNLAYNHKMSILWLRMKPFSFSWENLHTHLRLVTCISTEYFIFLGLYSSKGFLIKNGMCSLYLRYFISKSFNMSNKINNYIWIQQIKFTKIECSL